MKRLLLIWAICWPLCISTYGQIMQQAIVNTPVPAAGGTVATPAYNNDTGIYPLGTTSVTITDGTVGATIVYVLCASLGSDCSPVAGTTYSTPVAVIHNTQHLCSYATHAGMTDSATKCATYTIQGNLGNTSGSAGSASTGNNNVLYGITLTTGSNPNGYVIISATIVTPTFTGTAHHRFCLWPTANTVSPPTCQTSATTPPSLPSNATTTNTQFGTDCSAVTMAATTTYYLFINNDLAAAAYAEYTSGLSVTYDSSAAEATFAQTNYGTTVNLSTGTASEYPHMYLTVAQK